MNKSALWVSALALATTIGTATAEEEKVLNVYNWSDYIAEDTLRKFEAETGIKVNYDVFDSNEVLEAKLLAGNTGYDVVVPTASFLARQIKAGVFQKLDKSKLSNLKNMDPEILARVDVHDPGNEYAINYMWGTVGFGYNKKMIAERMPDAPIDSWDMVLKPDVVSKFADCGVSFLDAPDDVLPVVRNYVGAGPNSEDKGDLEKAQAVMEAVRANVRYFHSSQYISDLANGDTCLAVGWSGDVFQSRDRAAEADKGVEIDYVIPKEGTVIWFDMMAIPSDAPHPENAHKFLDFIMRPDIIAEISDYVFYANGNAASFDLIDKEVTEDPAIYPTDDVKEKLFASTVRSARYDRLQTRTWTKIKTGQ
ncbi:MAG: polyamine ABC transporter substrate-binding protein [Pseudomonadota bacterium]